MDLGRQRRQSVLTEISSSVSSDSPYLSEYGDCTSRASEEDEDVEQEASVSLTTRLLSVPVDPVWENTLLILAYLNIWLITLMAVKDFQNSAKTFAISVLIDVLFLIDNAIIILCKVLQTNMSSLHATRPNWIIVVELISIVPVVHTTAVMNAVGSYIQLFRYFQYLKTARIFFYMWYYRKMVGHQRMGLLLKLRFFFQFTMLIAIAFSVLLIINDCLTHQCSESQMLYLFSITVSSITNCGFIQANYNFVVQLVISLFSLASFIAVVCPSIALDINNYTTNYMQDHLFLFKMKCVKETLAEFGTSPHLTKHVFKFYEVYRKTRGAYQGDGLHLEILPDTMKIELATDISWYPLKHSKLFQNMDLPFLRAISLAMKQQFLIEGDVLWWKGQTKSSMIYIASGIVQVLSEEDQETPLLSLTAGTCFGECSIIIPSESSTTVLCKEYSEFHILTLRDFAGVARRFPKQAAKLKKAVNMRLQKALTLKKITEEYSIKHGLVKDEQTTLTWIKSTLHRLMIFSNSSITHECQNVYLREEFSKDKFSYIHLYANNLDLLAITERDQSTTDAVFVKYGFPCIFKPNSIILQTWQIIICLTVTIVSVIAPYYAFVEHETPHWFFSIMYAVTGIYWTDLCLTTCTAIRTPHEFINTSKKIFLHRCGDVYYWLDFFAAYPLEYQYPMTFSVISSQNKACLFLNRLLKVFRLKEVLNNFHNRMGNVHLTFVSSAKYVLLYVYVCYVSGCVLYAANCFNGDCAVPVEGESSFEKMRWYLYTSVQIIAAVGQRGRYYSLERHYYLYWILMFAAISMFVIIQVDIASTQILQQFPRIKLQEAFINITTVLNAHRVKESYKNRILSFLKTQWKAYGSRSFVFGDGVMQDLPSRTHAAVKEDALAAIIKTIPLFQDLPEDVTLLVCMASEIKIYPPKEVITHHGQVQRVFYYIMDGTCEVISYLTKTVEKMLGPGDLVAVLEACLCSHVVNTTLTNTYCRLLVFDIGAVLNALSAYPEQLLDFTETITASEDLKGSLESLFKRGSQKIVLDLRFSDEEEGSYHSFPYNLAVDSAEEYDYYVPFDRLQSLSFIRLLLMRFTVMPFGNLIFAWETFRCIFAIISALLFPINPIVTSSGGTWWLLLTLLDLTAWCDIYFRCHVCYYDKNNILIKHPLQTTLHYLKHGFLLDFVGAFPVHFFVKTGNAFSNKIYTAFHCNRLLQLHRYYHFYEVNDLQSVSPNKLISVLRFIPQLFVGCNLLASIIANIDCDFDSSITGNDVYYDGVVCNSDSWYSNSIFSRPYTPLYIHIVSIYFTSSLLSTVGMKGFVCKTTTDLVIQSIYTLLGLFVTLHVIAKVIAIYTTGNITHLAHLDGLNKLKRFLYKNKISVALQGELIRHAEITWQKKKGKDIHHVVQNLGSYIQTDMLYDVYGRILEEMSVFPQGAEPFFRLLLPRTTHFIVCSGTYLALVNDIKTKMHIVFKGRIDIIAPDGTKLTTIGIGGMFGNLDNYHRIRQTVAYRANGYVEILTIEALEFHQLLKNYPILNYRFKHLTAIHIDYLHGREIPKDVREDDISMEVSQTVTSKIFAFVFDPNTTGMSIWTTMHMCYACYFALLIALYDYTVNQVDVVTLIICYTADLWFLINFLLKFRTAFESDLGEIVKDLPSIRKHVMNDRPTLVLSILSMIPLDLLMWCLPLESDFKLRNFHRFSINRWLRVWYVYKFFKNSEQKINVNAMLIHTLSLVYFVTVSVHVFTCLAIDIGCLRLPNMNPSLHCEYIINGTALEKFKFYLDNLYLVVMCFARSSGALFYPLSQRLLLLHSTYMLCSLIFLAMILSKIYTMVKMKYFLQSEYQIKVRHMMHYLDRQDVSPTLVRRIWLCLVLLWKNERGSVYPKLLTVVPRLLQYTVLSQCYQHHIDQNVIFKKCHKDFRRQLARQLRARTFYDGDYIVFKGTVEECMYFIHEGEVLILTEDATFREDVVGKLVIGQFFCIVQGFNPVPSVYSFRSAADSVILKLDKAKWNYLLDFFPASKECISEALADYSGF